MAKKKNRSFVIQPKEVMEVRHGNPSMEELREYCEKRDRYVDAYGDRIADFLEISPMVPCDRWNKDPEDTDGDLLTKQERATAKGRRLAAEKRMEAKRNRN